MKWILIGLVLLGLLAGLFAALMVGSLQAASNGTLPPSESGLTEPAPIEVVPVLVAAMDLQPRSVVVNSSLATRSVPLDAVPESSFTDPVQLIGRVLVTPMAEGEAFSLTSFAGESSGLRLASALTPGTRAVSLTLGQPSGIERMLYPGSMVDVLTTLKALTDDDIEQTMTFTLLQNVMVLAVGAQSIVDPPGVVEQLARGPDQSTLTLLLDPAQAEKLRLAVAVGTVSVALRNPMDSASTETAGARIWTLAPLLGSIAERARLRREQRERDAAAEGEAQLKREEDERAQASMEGQEAASSTWDTLILRGGVAETKSFPAERTPR